jgi:hypothetical protein
MATDCKTLKAADLQQFHGTENWYRHSLLRNLLYTDGVKYVAEAGGAYWLIDLIASHQVGIRKKAFHDPIFRIEFQTWTLTVTGKSAVATCDDGDGLIMAKQVIEFTDFPLASIKLFCTFDGEHYFLMLPSEY